MCHPSRGPFSHRCPFTAFRASAVGYVVESLRDSRLYGFSPRPLATENYSAASVGALFWRAPQFNFTCGGEAFRVKVEFRPCFTGAGRFARLMSMGLLAKANTRKKEMGERGSLIASRDNRWLKRFRACLTGEEGGDGIVGVEGVRLVEAALGSGLPVEAVLVSASGERHLERLGGLIAPEMQILRTTDRLFAGLADTQTPQGVAALVCPKIATVEDVLRGVALVVVLVGVQDPGNVGTILRAAEAFGATGAATCAAGMVGTANPFAPKALRASAGSALRLPILRGMSSAILLAKLRVSGVRLYAAVPDSDLRGGRQTGGGPTLVRPWEADWKSPAALLIGNEGAGTPDEIVQSCDARVSIPQRDSGKTSGVESLNAAMAASVLLYEAMRQRGARD
jgi:TrmH family RNA methyltransferase